MRKILLTVVCLMIFLIHSSYAQNVLPNISVKSINGKVIISWKNDRGAEVTTINIQRSLDSLRNFSTFTSVLNPSNDENGVVDSKPLNIKMFYRVFIVFSGGTYVFSHSHRPVPDTVDNNTSSSFLTSDSIENTPKAPVNKWAKCIYTGKENNLIINLPDVQLHKYNIQFYNDANKQIFNIGKIEEPYLILDKVNFIRSGWFYYQLFDGEQFLDKSSFFIPKNTKTSTGN
jgi:hypothetical protein